ncbi:hypothetical protein SAMN04515647_2087 [Cohaesibacter sp. ES.047]|uniref:hypothetical protein n=1 Tax=Cohaesibacter sp. ES.047 TaxID=1798205 RepID=UPI000BC098B6|nr:hypothetical protein [Cohaesibacter sp. ES.047]SNY91844.1 hypothetical protein SAMN04515647_2087 [Cohaesibacter sp. ES.047]
MSGLISPFFMLLRKPLFLALIIPIAGLSLTSLATSAVADSCWWHNGSLMRLKARGNDRWFYYEQPRAGLSVSRGTLLFNGSKQGDWYVGTARVFSQYCPGSPQPYRAEGPVAPNQLRVTVQGDREIHKRCRPTGRWTSDTLVFTYAYRC